MTIGDLFGWAYALLDTFGVAGYVSGALGVIVVVYTSMAILRMLRQS